MTTIKTVERAIDMLECFSTDQPELSVGALAELLSVDKSAASRMAATLRDRRFLQLDPVSRRYRIGARVFELGQLFDRRETLTQIANPQLRLLVRDVGHASHVGVLHDGELLIVCCVESEHRLQVAVQVGERRALHATSAGKIFLAFGPEGLLEESAAAGRLVPVGPRTITSLAELKKEVASVRREGLAHNREESVRGVGAVACGIYGADKTLVASLTTVFPLSLVDAAEVKRIGEQVRATADRITLQLAGAQKARQPTIT